MTEKLDLIFPELLEDLTYKVCKLVLLNNSYHKKIKELLLSYGVNKIGKLSEEDMLEVNYIVDQWFIREASDD